MALDGLSLAYYTRSKVFSRYRLFYLRAAALVAIMASSALLWHYLAPENSGYCGEGSGCETVRKSFLNQLGPPYLVPLSGVIAFVLVFWLSFLEERKWVRWLGWLGGGIGLILLLVQAFGIGAFCWLCLLVDGAALTVAAACVLDKQTHSPTAEPLRGWAWFALLALALNGPSAWDELRAQEELPPEISAMHKPGVLNVIEFVDFQCPHCRRLHPKLTAKLRTLTEPVLVQRFHYPLQFHPLALGAAEAAICAGFEGKGDEMAELLLGHPLSAEAGIEHARRLKLNLDKFQQCLDSEACAKTLADHRRLFKAAGSKHLPLTFIGQERLEGSADALVIEAVFERALKPAFRLSPMLFLSALLGLVGLIVLLGWKRGQAAAKTSRAAH